MKDLTDTEPINISIMKPEGLMINFLQGSEIIGINSDTPEFGWIVTSKFVNDSQSAYHILIASSRDIIEQNRGDIWDTSKCDSGESINIIYRGKKLEPNTSYFWKVKTWCKSGGESSWSDVMKFTTNELNQEYYTARYPLKRIEIPALIIKKKLIGHYLIDFGKVAFGYLYLKFNMTKEKQRITIHIGERGNKRRVKRRPGRNIRYFKIKQIIKKGINDIEIHPPRNIKNTSGNAILVPEEFGIIAPFRYVELVHFPIELKKDMIKQIAIQYPFNDNASHFKSSNHLLNEIWDLCKYSMKATSFCGVYVDGDRERIPYEADAYINQLSHYAVDREYSIARYSHEYLLTHPTWPTEWKHHSVMMAWTDYMYTGNIKSLKMNYHVLKKKTLEHLAREDGLLNTKEERDNVDWPPKERDNYEFKEINTVINSFYYKTLLQMSDIANALGKTSEALEYQKKSSNVKKAFNNVLFDGNQGIYIDGENAKHASLHANMIPLAFGLVPEDRKDKVLNYIISRGMACSVYGAQYLLESLYEGGRSDIALKLLTSKEKRSWYNMLKVGSTITLEAWDNKFKPNQDWNHAWGAVPGNIISRYLMGIRPIEPGFNKVLIMPQPASLEKASATVPTIRGPIVISFENNPPYSFSLKVEIPVNMSARVGIPQYNKNSTTLIVDDNEKKAKLSRGYLFIDGIGSGVHTLTSN